MELFIWESFKTVAEIGLKEILGKSFDRLLKHKENNDIEKFKEILEIVMDNEKTKQNLENLKNNIYITQKHSGSGDNIGNQTINNYQQNMKEDIKSHSLYKSSLFLDEVKMSSEPLSDDDYRNINKLIEKIKLYDKNNYYGEEVKALLPNDDLRRMRESLDEFIPPRIEDNQDRRKIHDNKAQIRDTIFELINQPR